MKVGLDSCEIPYILSSQTQLLKVEEAWVAGRVVALSHTRIKTFCRYYELTKGN